MRNEYRVCARCVMDTTAQEIEFDDQGVCNFCRDFDVHVARILATTEEELASRFRELVAEIKSKGKGQPFDSVVGLSGGTDSSYLCHLCADAGLRPLVVTVDTGWDSPESAENIRRLSAKLPFEFRTVAVDWEEMRDLQVAYYKAAVQNCEVPQDHVFLAILYEQAAKTKVRSLLTGGNLATESILPASWSFNAADLRNLKAIHRRFGTKPLQRFQTLPFWKRYAYYPFVRGIREMRLLNFVPYNRREAKRLLEDEYGWQDYGPKHYESILTRFFQAYVLLKRFGIDKRRAHFSSLIVSGQMDRDEALRLLEAPPYPNEELLEEDMAHIAQKLDLSLEEWKGILALPPRAHTEFPSSQWLFSLKDTMVRGLGVRRRWWG